MRGAPACALAWVLLVGTARHARADRHDPAAAEALFRAARASAERGDYASACSKFEESNRLDPTVGAVFNLADCNEHLGRLATAWQLFKEAAQRFSSSDDRLALANARAARLEPKLPHLVLKPDPAFPRDAIVKRDGVRLGTASFGVPLPVDPGEHTVTVEVAGRSPTTRTVRLDVGQAREIQLEVGSPLQGHARVADAALAPRPVTASASSVDSDERGDGRKTWGAVLLGAGGVGIAGSLVLGGLALSEKNTVDASCSSATMSCTDEGIAAARRGRLETTAANVAFAVGAATAGIGTYLLLSSGKTASASVAGVSASLAPGQGFVTVSGAFH